MGENGHIQILNLALTSLFTQVPVPKWWNTQSAVFLIFSCECG